MLATDDKLNSFRKGYLLITLQTILKFITMKKKNLKLNFNKETIAKLQMNEIQGGGFLSLWGKSCQKEEEKKPTPRPDVPEEDPSESEGILKELCE